MCGRTYIAEIAREFYHLTNVATELYRYTNLVWKFLFSDGF
jgi:hypothetical protein